MKKFLSAILIGLVAQSAAAQDSPIGNETPAAEQAPDSAAIAPAAAAADENKPFTPPPGFKTKKRGELVLYCIRDSTVGTRFKTEKCFNEDQVRDYLIAQQENKRDIDRVRSTCSSGAGEICSRE